MSIAQALPLLASSRTVEATVTHVADGDTLTAETKSGTKLRIRLAGIDAPEIPHGTQPGQPYGHEATVFLEHLTMGKTVSVNILGVDRYRRLLACVITQDSILINRALVEAGLAEVYRGGNRKDCTPGLDAVEADARNARREMWSLDRYESPADFRRRMRLRGH
jgi:endonuclease YncB( thermonuclease family)